MAVVDDFTALLSGTYWGGIEVTGPRFLTYSFLGAAPAAHGTPEAMGSAVPTFRRFDAQDREVARAALDQWADACGLTLLEVAPGRGSVTFSWYEFSGTVWEGYGALAFLPFGEWNSLSHPYFTDQMAAGGLAGDVFFNLDVAIGGLPDTHLLLHEIGHALGFKHPFEVSGTHEETLDASVDTVANTAMSYSGPWTGALGPLDLAAAAHAYGPADSDGSQAASWSWDAALARLTQEGGAGDDLLQGVTVADAIAGQGGADTLLGQDGPDTLDGGEGNDLLFGGGAADHLVGGAGADTMVGGRGSDLYEVDDPFDWVVETPDQGNDLVVSSAAYFWLWDGVERLTLSGTADADGFGNAAANRMTGNAGANRLAGFGGRDNLLGQEGDDTLEGGADRDVLTGGEGNDLFVFESSAGELDVIVDFVPGTDAIALRAAGFAGLGWGPLAPADLVAQDSLRATSAAGVAQLVYNTDNGILAFDADGAGGAAALRFARLLGAPALGAGDIVLV